MQRRNLFFIVIILLFCSEGCKKADLSDENRKLIKEHFKLLNDHNLKELATQYSSKVLLIYPESAGVEWGPGALIRRYELCFTYCRDTRFKVEKIIVEDSIVVVKYDVVGEPVKKSPTQTNFYPYGIHTKNCTIFKIKNNKIVSEDIYTNEKYYQD